MTESNKNIFYFLLFLAMLSWGASWVNVKVLSSYINEFETMFLRFFITAITMIPIILVLKKSFKIDLKSLGLVIITSIVFICYMKYFFLGTKYGTASLGGAFVTTLIPINTFLILALFGEKKITKKDAFALFIGAIGVLTMLNIWSFKTDEIFLIQNLYFILASIFWPIITILSSKSTKISPIVFTFYLYIATSILNIIFFVDISKINYQSFDEIFYINLFVLTIIASTFANTIYFLGIEKLGAREVSSFIFFVPFAAIILSAFFLKEKITPSIIIGTILTIIAVQILNNIKIRRKKKIEQRD
ncbi:DMT family transporter [Halarcobacter anaerophilus]|uniref:EamA family transporter n=1 Tax=Halarcobacter anaerophilus TaxID=877500 RepID=A0A4Q0XX00_9BACT|nr:DMT family transporter [Halarcobacter anaerophilus]QDF28299.1 EamA/RhaT family transporter [Halarcobacter anaerophilus]RXJ62032.1 EamA family transporter [Halarcobacter anaerophilus]